MKAHLIRIATAKRIIYLAMVLFMAVVMMQSFKVENPAKPVSTTLPKDSVGSVKAFMSVYRVLKSSRCMNCHPSEDA
ncbi:MAG: hypothetical protein ABI166_16770, partial [Mucilaginibacter sp.]